MPPSLDPPLNQKVSPFSIQIGLRTFYVNGEPAETFSFTLEEGRTFLKGNERMGSITISADFRNGKHLMKRKIYIEDLKRALTHGELALELATKGKSAESAEITDIPTENERKPRC